MVGKSGSRSESGVPAAPAARRKRGADPKPLPPSDWWIRLGFALALFLPLAGLMIGLTLALREGKSVGWQIVITSFAATLVWVGLATSL